MSRYGRTIEGTPRDSHRPQWVQRKPRPTSDQRGK